LIQRSNALGIPKMSLPHRRLVLEAKIGTSLLMAIKGRFSGITGRFNAITGPDKDTNRRNNGDNRRILLRAAPPRTAAMALTR
jgi:hypothetical protein